MKTKYLLIAIICLAIFLRAWKLGEIPISLHGDEVGVGYNAFSLLKDGVDEYGKPWPLVFRADVPPVIFYATIPSIAIFGNTNLAVRIPSVIAGIITVLLFLKLMQGFLAIENANKIKFVSTSLFATLTFAVTPVFVQLSRIAHDGNYALLFQFVGILAFLHFLRHKQIYWWYISVLIMGIAAYSYHAPRLTGVLLLCGWGWWARKLLKKKYILFSISIYALIVSPIILDLLTKPVSQTRIGGINIFIGEKLSLMSTLLLPMKLGMNYLAQFDITQLFLDSQTSRYFNLNQTGLLFITLVPFLLYGILMVWKKIKYRFLLLWWLLISVTPGALTQGPANIGRIIFLFPVLIIFISYGYMFLISKNVLKKSFLVVLAIGLFSINVGWFLHQYYVDSTQRFRSQWQYGQENLAREVVRLEPYAEKIVISDSLKQAYVYILFYGNKSIHEVLTSPQSKRHPFIGYSSFGKYEFRPINWNKDMLLHNSILIGTRNEFPADLFIKQNINIQSTENFQIVMTK